MNKNLWFEEEEEELLRAIAGLPISPGHLDIAHPLSLWMWTPSAFWIFPTSTYWDISHPNLDIADPLYTGSKGCLNISHPYLVRFLDPLKSPSENSDQPLPGLPTAPPPGSSSEDPSGRDLEKYLEKNLACKQILTWTFPSYELQHSCCCQDFL